MTTDDESLVDLPTFAETSNADVWRYRQEQEREESIARGLRRGAESELLERANEIEATVLGTEFGDITCAFSDKYSYDTQVVEQRFLAACREAGLDEEIAQFVTRSYKIDRRFLNKLEKRGHPFPEVIDAMTNAALGKPQWKGPSLKEITAREEAQVGTGVRLS